MIRWFVPRFMFPICLFLWSAAAVAQTGSISGSVVDQTGLLLPGATVTLRGEGGPRTAYADEQGNFELSGVASGTYALTVSLAGFSDAVVEDVTVGGAALESAAGRAATRQIQRHDCRDRIARGGPPARRTGIDIRHHRVHARDHAGPELRRPCCARRRASTSSSFRCVTSRSPAGALATL